MIQSVQVIIHGNQQHSYRNAIKTEQLVVGKQLLISTLLINLFGTSIIDQHVRESVKLINFYHFFPRAVQLCSQLDFKGTAARGGRHDV